MELFLIKLVLNKSDDLLFLPQAVMENTVIHCGGDIAGRHDRRARAQAQHTTIAPVARPRIPWGLSGAFTTEKRWNLLLRRQIQLSLEPRHQLFDELSAVLFLPVAESQTAVGFGSVRIRCHPAELLQSHLRRGALSVRHTVRLADRNTAGRFGDMGEEIDRE